MDVSASADGTGAVNLLDLTDGSSVSAGGDTTAPDDSEAHSTTSATGHDLPDAEGPQEDIEPEFWDDDEEPRRFLLSSRAALLIVTGVLVIIAIAVIMFFLGKDQSPSESTTAAPSAPAVQDPDPVVVESPPPPPVSEPPSPPVKPRPSRRPTSKPTTPPPSRAKATEAPSRPPTRRPTPSVTRLVGAPTAAPPPPETAEDWPARLLSAPPPPTGRPPLTVSATVLDLSAAQTAPLVLAAPQEQVSWSLTPGEGLAASATSGTLMAGQNATVLVNAAPAPAGPPAGCGQVKRGSITVHWSLGADPARTMGTHTVAVAFWVPCR
ncbi:hypothetical protein [Streptosporangium sandarakinum]|uniref:hypothetical protein n=1 Tax=Streptosporangium sandarakinum TaxID=1260955 RepID=UPI00371116F1